jgi:hypothetical protein
MLGRLFSHQITIRSLIGGELDQYGNATSTATTTTVLGRVVPITGAELVDDEYGLRNSTVQRVGVFLPAGTNVTATDELVIADQVYRITTPPLEFQGFNAPHHIELTAERVQL